jgi:hypothetical protein
VTAAGAVTRFHLPATTAGPAHPNDIIGGPGGALWATEYGGDAIVRIETNGSVSSVFPLTPEAAPRFLAFGDDGNIWFTENGSPFTFGDSSTPPQIVKMTPSGEMTTYAMPSANSAPDSIRRAKGGFIFSDLGTNAVGFIGYDGNVVEYPLPIEGNVNGNVQFALQGSDDAFYFSDVDMHRLGKITLGKKGMIFPSVVSLVTGAQQLVGVAVDADRGPFTAAVDDPSIATVSPIPGFTSNFVVLGIGAGQTTLTIKGKGKPMNATITVSARISTASVRRAAENRTL